MFCKNCGSTMTETDERCSACQYKAGFGKNYCQFCGKKLEDGESVCSQCGNEISGALKEAAPKEETKKPVEKKKYDADEYKPKFMKLNIFALCAEIASLLLILSIIFLPIYKSKYEPNLEDIESWDQFGEALEKGYLEENFSAFDDFTLLTKALFAKDDGSDGELSFLNKMVVFETGLFVFFEIIFAVILIVMLAKKVFELVNNIRNIDDNALLRYNEIKKSGRQDVRPNFFQKQSVFSIVVYAIFDIIFTKLFDELFSFGGIEVKRHMNTISGPSGYVSIVIILLAVIVAAKVLYKKEEDGIRLQIAKSEQEEE